MKNRNREDAENNTPKSSEGSKEVAFKKNFMKKNIRRTGGRAISTNAYFNPAEIKKQREFYKNAKYVNKYKKSVKEQPATNALPSIEPLEEEKKTVDDSRPNKHNKKRKTREPRNIVEIYEKKHEEKEKVRMEREAIFQAKKEEREKSEARRKAAKEKMMKRTRKGQPVMKYRIEHLLETIQGCVNKS